MDTNGTKPVSLLSKLTFYKKESDLRNKYTKEKDFVHTTSETARRNCFGAKIALKIAT